MSKVEVEYIRHILDEISFVIDQTKGLKENEFMKNEVLQRALVRSLEVIGEAVKNLSSEYRERNGEINWKSLAGLRDKLIHHYFGVDYGIVWDVAVNELPELKVKLDKLI